MMIVSLAACDSKPAESSVAESPAVESSTEPAAEPTEEPASEPTEEPASEPTEEPATDDLRIKLVPEGVDAATVMGEGNNFTFTTDKAFADLQAFYETAVKDLGATEIAGGAAASMPEVSGLEGLESWAYAGTLPDGQTISIGLAGMAGQTTVVVAVGAVA